MTPEAVRVAIAEACGWKRDGIRFVKDGVTAFLPPVFSEANLPDYLNDLNACAEMRKCVPEGKRLEYSHTLANVVDPIHNNEYISTLMWTNTWPMLDATAAQHCEAFCRAMGIFKK